MNLKFLVRFVLRIMKNKIQIRLINNKVDKKTQI